MKNNAFPTNRKFILNSIVHFYNNSIFNNYLKNCLKTHTKIISTGFQSLSQLLYHSSFIKRLINQHQILNPRLLVAIPITSFLLSGCTHLNSQFDCPMKPGVMCQSLDQVNTKVDQKQLGYSSHSNKYSHAKDENIQRYSLASNDSSARTCTDSFCTSKNLARIWVAPYEDSDGNQYAETAVYRVILPSISSTNSTKISNDRSQPTDRSDAKN